MRRAQELESQQNLPAAIEALSKAVERQPANAHARLQLGFCRERSATRPLQKRSCDARWNSALRWPVSCLLSAPRCLKCSNTVSCSTTFRCLAICRPRIWPCSSSSADVAHLALGDAADARTQFLTAVQYRPEEARLGLALVAAFEGDLTAADKLVDQVIAESPQSGAAWSVLGDLRQLRGEDAAAVEAYRRAVSLDAGNVRAAASEAVLLVRAGDYAGARKLIERAHGLRPGDVVVNFARAVLALHAGDVSAGRESIDRVRRTVPDHPLTTVLDAALLAAAGQLEQSEGVLSSYLRRDASDTYARKLLAGALLTKQLPDQALTVLQPLLTSEQRDPEVLALAGRSELQTGALRTGLERLKLAVAVTPGDARLRADLGLAQLALGNAAAAVDELRASAHGDSGGFNADLLLIAVLIGKNGSACSRRGGGCAPEEAAQCPAGLPGQGSRACGARRHERRSCRVRACCHARS
jgi:tetratricopeptide (TPR) repeat protein